MLCLLDQAKHSPMVLYSLAQFAAIYMASWTARDSRSPRKSQQLKNHCSRSQAHPDLSPPDQLAVLVAVRFSFARTFFRLKLSLTGKSAVLQPCPRGSRWKAAPQSASMSGRHLHSAQFDFIRVDMAKVMRITLPLQNMALEDMLLFSKPGMCLSHCYGHR